jgi:hypothetical protein
LKTHVGPLPRDRLKSLPEAVSKNRRPRKIAGHRGFSGVTTGRCWRCAVFDSSPDHILRIVQLAQERARLLERLAVIVGELMSSMPTLLTAIAATSQTPLSFRDFVIRVIKSEYRLLGEVDILTVASAALKRLVEKGVLKRDRESQGYVFVGPD